MIIVAGHLRIDPELRQDYLDGCIRVIESARAAQGCHDYHLSADLLEPDRVNIFEAWETAAAVESFRGSGPDDGQVEMIRSAAVSQFEVSSETNLSG